MKNLVGTRLREDRKIGTQICPVRILPLGREVLHAHTPQEGTKCYGDSVGIGQNRLDPAKLITELGDDKHDQTRLEKVIQFYDASLVNIKLLI